MSSSTVFEHKKIHSQIYANIRRMSGLLYSVLTNIAAPSVDYCHREVINSTVYATPLINVLAIQLGTLQGFSV